MRNLFIIFMIMALVLAVGCAKQTAPPEQVTEPVNIPQMNPVQPEAEKETVKETAPAATEAEEPANTTLGSRVTGTGEGALNETVKEEVVPAKSTEIKLTADKTMSMSSIIVKTGTTLSWKNYDTWPHQLSVEQGKGYDVKSFGKSTRLLEGNVWSYKFDKSGIYVVRDIFSGAMRMNVTVNDY